ncbi:hypothetical protein PFISCL1PPCAC_22413, partial [Pristionchus fissidentatus]
SVPCEKVEEPACEEDEICGKLDHTYKCAANFHTMFRQTPTSNFTKVTITCTEGDVTVKDGNAKKIPYLSGESIAKCARKKCSHCKFEATETGDFPLPKYTPSDAFDKCSKIECENGGFMVINENVATSEAVQCSSITPDTEETNAKWTVEEQPTQIKRAQCKE